MQWKERLPEIGNLMINESRNMKDSVIFPRKYQKMSSTCVWHISDLMRNFANFMTILAFLISSFLLVYKTLAFTVKKNSLIGVGN